MNIADILIKEKVEALKGAKQKFCLAMNKAIVKYDNERLITDVIMDEERLQTESGELTPELKRFKLKCKVQDLIEMDKAQIEAATDWKLEKIGINVSFDLAEQARAISTSAWFTGEPSNRTFY
ncbi:hypothetical protein [Serratia phage X20]|uniref:Uncharacterized protein n=1 Tax=Serratia phage X20 TaxID=2006942 RepID=A0A1Z1LYZ7_9CAUD|nr:hypothetical protein KNT72_gp088 [Serratia phage X20]ARW58061.1 hypothetical protein [Serratia phage X20]